MLINNISIFTGDRFVKGGIEFTDTIHDAGVDVTSAGAVDGKGAYLIPGLID